MLGETTDAKDRQILSLTGLRALAAGSVLLGHAVPKLVPYSDPPEWYVLAESLSAVGMPLFFVLSGFVIHTNYRDLVRGSPALGSLQFIIARIARLYPLFILFFAIELLIDNRLAGLLDGNGVLAGSVARSLPFYLTLTQSWFYAPDNGHALIYQFGFVGSVSWSISTEMFFYVCYPVVAFGVAYLTSVRAKAAAIAAIVLATYAALALVASHNVDINAQAVAAFGAIADQSTNKQDSFIRWLVYFSPYFRIGEFLIGVLVAAIYASFSERPVTPTEQTIGSIALVLAVSAIGIVFWQLMGWAGSSTEPIHRFASFLNQCMGLAPLIGVTIFCAARYRGWLVRFLASRPLLIAGEASYSIYLLHLTVIDAFASKAIPVTWFGGPLAASGIFAGLIRLLFVILVVIGVAIVIHSVWEIPARRFVRRALLAAVEFGRRAFVSRRGYSYAVVGTCLVGAMLLVSVPSAETAGNLIKVTSATYGANCSAPADNTLAIASRVCDGRARCNFVVDVNFLGDPKSGCAKDFSIGWSCTASKDHDKRFVEPEAGLGTVTTLACPRMHQ